VPAGLRPPPGVPLDPGPVLIGDPTLNLLLGAEILKLMGHREAARVWLDAVERI